MEDGEEGPQQAIHALDLAILMGGPRFRPDLDAAIAARHALLRTHAEAGAAAGASLAHHA